MTCIVMVMVMRSSADDRKIRVTKRFFLRDIFFVYLIVLYVLYILTIKGSVDIWHAIGFFAIYFVFVIIVVIQSK